MTTKKTKKLKTANKGQNLVEKLAVPVTAGKTTTGVTPAAPANTGGSSGAANGSTGTGGEGEKETGKRGTTFARDLYFIEVALTNSLNDPLIRQYVPDYFCSPCLAPFLHQENIIMYSPP